MRPLATIVVPIAAAVASMLAAGFAGGHNHHKEKSLLADWGRRSGREVLLADLEHVSATSGDPDDPALQLVQTQAPTDHQDKKLHITACTLQTPLDGAQMLLQLTSPDSSVGQQAFLAHGWPPLSAAKASSSQTSSTHRSTATVVQLLSEQVGLVVYL
jgi:hypothetical protein